MLPPHLGIEIPKIDVEEAAELFEALLDRVEKGEELIITRDGNPVAKLVSANPTGDRE